MTDRRPESPWRSATRRLRRNRGAVAGLYLVLALVAVAVFADRLAPYDPVKINPEAALRPPGRPFLLGTDTLGRDVLSRLVHGARISLRVGLVSVSIAAALGTTLGLLAGYYGRWLDLGIMRFIDLLLAFPSVLLALAIIAILGPSIFNLMIAVGISATPAYARLVRGSVLSARENTYVEAARAVGCSDRLIIWRHILPNVLAPLIVLSTLGMAGAILTGAALSFLGLGVQPPTPEWGVMLSDGRNYLRRAWWITTFPGMAIMITVLAINMLGDGLRDALDPRLRM
ncbi:MAG: ABC transporter permease [Armatimonadota bacterium]|nr:ABC transporter permease [Armatimonadota bacterium]MDR7485230.1 ABC transporter permease [Armatimonadota bacterium]MDR7533991.1 ABC transporter permease [Armatimonadota bacterium]MDR7536522.1 ABC transporter permease [Armatimonadota bacterium]